MSVYLMNLSASQLLTISPVNEWEAKYLKTRLRPQIICMATWETLKSIHLQSLHSVKAQEQMYFFLFMFVCISPSLPLNAV